MIGIRKLDHLELIFVPSSVYRILQFDDEKAFLEFSIIT
jgi:hypothetical protein